MNVVVCGRRFGKSTLGVRILKGPIRRKRTALWAAPTYDLLRAAWADTIRVYEPIITGVNKQERELRFAGGGAVHFRTLDDPQRVGRSYKYDLAIIDEAALVRHLEEAWHESIRPTLTDYAGGAWFLSTPKGMNYFKHLYDQADRPGWSRWQMPTSANPYIAATEIEAAREEMPSIVFQQEYLAQFVDAAGARVKREWLRHGDAPTGLAQVVMGVDLAISTRDGADWTAAVVLARAPDGTTWVLAAERTRAAFHDVVNFVRAMAERHKPSIIAIEQVQYQAAVVQELLRKTNLPVRGVRPDRDKLTRFLPLEARYEQGLVWHARGLSDYEDELLSFPEGAHDDLVDAAAYAFNSMTKPETNPAAARLAARRL
jgi:predicted phage terminase large subunit-like protein